VRLDPGVLEGWEESLWAVWTVWTRTGGERRAETSDDGLGFLIYVNRKLPIGRALPASSGVAVEDPQRFQTTNDDCNRYPRGFTRGHLFAHPPSSSPFHTSNEATMHTPVVYAVPHLSAVGSTHVRHEHHVTNCLLCLLCNRNPLWGPQGKFGCLWGLARHADTAGRGAALLVHCIVHLSVD